MTDAQSRYNLANLAVNRKVDTDQLAVFQRLLTNLKLDAALAQSVANLVANAQKAAVTTTTGSGTGTSGTSGTGGGTGTTTMQNPTQSSNGAEPMDLVRVEDLLAVSGFTPPGIEQLRDFVIILPQGSTKVNVNTAPAELIAALVPNLPLSDAAAMVNNRNRGAYYRDTTDFTKQPQMSAAARTAAVPVDVRSNYFLAFSRVRLDRAALDTQSLLMRQGATPTSVVWIREN
jgi:general secretion pathway protein K